VQIICTHYIKSINQSINQLQNLLIMFLEVNGNINGKYYENEIIKNVEEFLGQISQELLKKFKKGFIDIQHISTRSKSIEKIHQEFAQGLSEPVSIRITSFRGSINGDSIDVRLYKSKSTDQFGNVQLMDDGVDLFDGNIKDRYYTNTQKNLIAFILLHPYNANSPCNNGNSSMYFEVDYEKSASERKEKMALTLQMQSKFDADWNDGTKRRLHKRVLRGIIFEDGSRIPVSDWNNDDEIYNAVMDIIPRKPNEFDEKSDSNVSLVLGTIDEAQTLGVLSYVITNGVGIWSYTSNSKEICKVPYGEEKRMALYEHCMIHGTIEDIDSEITNMKLAKGQIDGRSKEAKDLKSQVKSK
jgi:hypothetical protein